MGVERHVFDQADESAEQAADARAEADVIAKRLVSHQAVTAWLADIADGKLAGRPKVGD